MNDDRKILTSRGLVSDAEDIPTWDEYLFLEQQLGEARKEITRLRNRLRRCEEETPHEKQARWDRER